LAKQSGGNERAEAGAAFWKLLGSTVQGPVGLFFGGEPNADGTADYRPVPIEKRLGHDLVDLINLWRSKTRKHSTDSALREYDSAPQPEGHQLTQFIDLEGDTHLKKALAALKAATDLPAWTPADPRVGNPRSFVIEAALKDDGRARFFGRITKGKQLQGPGRVVAFFEGERFHALVEQKVIIVDATFDCVQLDTYLFILKPTGFESLFSYEISLAANAKKTMDSMAQYLEPVKLASLRSAVDSNRLLLRQIAGRIRIDLKTADPERIREAIDRCKFNVTIDFSGGKLRLGFAGDDPQDLIKLLTERGVESIVSGKPYIATALEAVRA
jgi:hypothetical protein